MQSDECGRAHHVEAGLLRGGEQGGQRLGFGRMVGSETEAPNILEDLV